MWRLGRSAAPLAPAAAAAVGLSQAKLTTSRCDGSYYAGSNPHADYYASKLSQSDRFDGNVRLPAEGRTARHAERFVKDIHEMDFRHKLNTSSYVNVVFEEEEERIVKTGMRINLADQTVYPASFKLHDNCVNMMANLWHCPEPADFAEKGVHAGAQTVGSTEACLLAGLCMKFRWRKWYMEKHGLTEEQVLGVRPNLVISTQFQACWEKLFRYMDIEPRLVETSVKDFKLTPEGVKNAVDDKTIGVVAIMGNHYGGQYDQVHEIDALLTKLNKERGTDLGIHVDAASGGFIAPFQTYLKPWDFRCPNVLSISASGHKFGESICGTGWVVWRQRQGLSEHVAVSVSYLGGKGESYTLNFSRPASACYVQFYKFLRLGWNGYAALEQNMMHVAKHLRDKMKKMEVNGKPRFEILDDGDAGCLPVVTARLNPELKLPYDDIDLQHELAKSHWYVSGYKMSMNHPLTEEIMPLFHDAPQDSTMFRVVVKSNLTMYLMDDLISHLEQALEELDSQTGKKLSKKKKLQQHHSHVC
eukprot:TRINITY_DN26554_c0_g1_i1.p1 TRINITY_DN26554_c0_g1~~TRINITY_DN26554_c0_g1_i1.p1  ORF type:complete len:530 (-),score=144.46 TRINITY_DN26554_c0_g1_i1:410-1999(-)